MRFFLARIVVPLFFIVFFVALTFIKFPLAQHVEASPPATPLSGYAWNDHTGWISFSGSGYGVSVTGTTLSGYAWSDGAGWVSFNISDLTGCPSGTCSAQLVGTQLIGWAKICSGVAICGGSNWISLVDSSGGGSSQTFNSSGTFTVPAYSSLIVTVKGAGGGGGGATGEDSSDSGAYFNPGNSGGNGIGNTSFNGNVIAGPGGGGGGGGYGGLASAHGSPGFSGSASGGDTNTSGAAGSGGSGGVNPILTSEGYQNNGGNGGSGGKAVKTYAAGALSGNVTIVVGTGGAQGAGGYDSSYTYFGYSPNAGDGGVGGSGSVQISWTSPTYGPILTGSNFSGYAWSDLIGWIDFSQVKYGVDICTDITGTQSFPPTGCQVPNPNPGTCIPSGYYYDGTQCLLAPAQIITFSASPTRTRKNVPTTVTFTWKVLNPPTPPATCLIKNPDGSTLLTISPTDNTTQSQSTSITISQSSTYTLSCGSSPRAQATITLVPTVQEI